MEAVEKDLHRPLSWLILRWIRRRQRSIQFLEILWNIEPFWYQSEAMEKESNDNKLRGASCQRAIHE